MARETINGISVPVPGTGEPADFVSDLRRIATDLSASTAGKAKDVEGGAFLKPVRVPMVVTERAWPDRYVDYRILWTENAGQTLYGWSSHDYRLRKSTDGGSTWTRKGLTVSWGAPGGVGFLKTAAGTLLVQRSSNTAEIFRSTDDGETWTSVFTGAIAGQIPMGVMSWAIDPTTGYIYYGEYQSANDATATVINVYRSTDDGATWAVFYAFPARASGDPNAVRHVHSVQWDHVAERIVVMTGDSDAAAGMYRVNAAGDGLEPLLLNRDIPAISNGARAIGIIPFADYLAWTCDSTPTPYLMRMHRSEIGKANPVVEKVYRLNSCGWFTCRASDDGSRWVFSSSQEQPGRLDPNVHLYAVEDQGATVYEVGALPPGPVSSIPALSPIGAPEIHGDTFFLQAHGFNRYVFWKLSLARGSGAGSLALPQGSPHTQTQTFTTSGTWTMPAGARRIRVLLVGPGGGGGAGARGPSGSAMSGGGGGGGGAVSAFEFNAADLPETVAVTVGVGGAGGAAQAADSTAGANGGSPGLPGTTFGTYLVAGRGAGGTGGDIGAAGTGGAGGATGIQAGGAGGSGQSTGQIGLASGTPQGAAGGGGGGGVNGSTPTGWAGGDGGYTVWTRGSLAAGGTAPGGAGTAGAHGLSMQVGGGGGGGAGGGSGPGGDGADGGTYGAGGGGGGASINGQTSGKGGRGSNGIAIVTTYF